MGKRSRAAGARHELKVRKDLEAKGWLVDKWTNNVDLDAECIVKAKMRFIGGRPAGIGTGFPDFVCFRRGTAGLVGEYKLQLVEAKMTGKLDKKEKLKLNFLKSLGFLCFIAKKGDSGIIYEEFEGYTPK